MGALHKQSFLVRFDECDAQGYLRSISLFRYLQEMAIRGSDALGYDQAWYKTRQRLWVASDTQVESFSPILYGDELEITTWVGSAQKIRGVRNYEVRRQGDDTIIAQGQTSWIFIDSSTGRPTAIPPELINAFVYPSKQLTSSEALPILSAASANAFTVEKKVDWLDIDQALHVNNAAYIGYIETAQMQTLAAGGWPFTRLLQEKSWLVPQRYRLEYKLPAELGDILSISVWKGNSTSNGYLCHYIITRPRDNATILRATVQYQWFSLEKQQQITDPVEANSTNW
ncbi:MAG: hypothetical protein KatS3mg057_1267 [Herpetosiphonaceae bacterium]|nr:MAG: hypothetical protein KatS3mg057_1267 [Herpetosiphonaceae bacterium]